MQYDYIYNLRGACLVISSNTKRVIRINAGNALTTPIQSRYGTHSEGRQNINIIHSE